MTAWAILTCEYPPGCGGVGDYTAQVAAALVSSGDDVTVFCPPMSDSPIVVPGVEVVVLPDVYGPRSRRVIDSRFAQQRAASRDPRAANSEPRAAIILVQYVPTAFGLRGANLPWCRWLQRHARSGRGVRVMFHEPYFEFVRTPIAQNALAVVQRQMARTLLRAADHVYLSRTVRTKGPRSVLDPADSISDTTLRSSGRSGRPPANVDRFADEAARWALRYVRGAHRADGPIRPDRVAIRGG
jgi:hypothetical protein